MKPLQTPRGIGAVSARTVVNSNVRVPGRICALRKTGEAIHWANTKVPRRASCYGRQVQPATLGAGQVRHSTHMSEFDTLMDQSGVAFDASTTPVASCETQ